VQNTPFGIVHKWSCGYYPSASGMLNINIDSITEGPMKRIFVPVCMGLLLLCLMSCTKSERKESAGKGAGEQEGFSVTNQEQDLEIAKAISSARSTVRVFLDALKAPKRGQSDFAVKKLFKDEKNVDHIWLTKVTFDGKMLHGVVNNEPVGVKTVKFGDMATVLPEEISDWMFLENGTLKGGYTIRAYYDHLSREEKINFMQQNGFTIE
jgi:uncharacterized protein YegJ (DUF2314 family)